MSVKPRREKKGMKGMERIGQYCPEESIVRKVEKTQKALQPCPKAGPI